MPAAAPKPANSNSAAPAATPMMAQYWALKEKAGDCLLFYRMGDFFELFFDDAKAAAATLDIALTSRGEHEGQPVAMCGVPVHAAESYLARLIRAGHRVAIAEQVETPAEAKARGGSKALVARAIVRFVTAGTLTEESLLEGRSANRLAALAEVGSEGEVAIAAADISTGRFEVVAVRPEAVDAELARLAPSELLVSESARRRYRHRPRASSCGGPRAIFRAPRRRNASKPSSASRRSTASAPFRAARLRRWARSSPISTMSAPARRPFSSRRCAISRRAAWRSTPRRARASNSSAPWRERATAACSARSIAPSPRRARGCSPTILPAR